MIEIADKMGETIKNSFIAKREEIYEKHLQEELDELVMTEGIDSHIYKEYHNEVQNLDKK